MESGFDISISDIVETMNTLILERHIHSESCIIVKRCPRKQRAEIYLPNEEFGLAFFSTGLAHIYGIIVGNEFGLMLRGKRPHKPKFTYDIVRIHTLIIYTGLIEYNIVGNTKILRLRCFLFHFKAESRRHYKHWTIHEPSDI